MSSLSYAEGYPVGDLMVTDIWSRPLPEVSVNGAAYLTIHNNGAKSDRLLGATSEVAEEVQIHTHINQNGLMKMVHLEQGAELPPGEVVKFQPGGLHVMLLGLASPLTEETEYGLTLEFETSGKLDVVVRVEERNQSSMDHSSHMKQSGSSD
ncbi:MAG: copper chaperone PCu(A)C [Arenicellales bacterium]